MTIPIVYQDEFIVAVNKPAGLLVHRSDIDKRETRFLVQKLRDQVKREVYPIHRLDKSTSGLLILSLSKECVQPFAALFREHDIVKKYYAVVRGYTHEEGIIDHPLQKISDKKSPTNKEYQDARSDYYRLDTIELPYLVDRYPTARYSLVEVTLHTGRRHQIRRHLKHISHPIIGDPKYGKSIHNNFFMSTLGVSGLLLTSVSMEFVHPILNKKMKLTAPPDNRFKSILDQFSWWNNVNELWKEESNE